MQSHEREINSYLEKQVQVVKHINLLTISYAQPRLLAQSIVQVLAPSKVLESTKFLIGGTYHCSHNDDAQNRHDPVQVAPPSSIFVALGTSKTY